MARLHTELLDRDRDVLHDWHDRERRAPAGEGCDRRSLWPSGRPRRGLYAAHKAASSHRSEFNARSDFLPWTPTWSRWRRAVPPSCWRWPSATTPGPGADRRGTARSSSGHLATGDAGRTREVDVPPRGDHVQRWPGVDATGRNRLARTHLHVVRGRGDQDHDSDADRSTVPTTPGRRSAEQRRKTAVRVNGRCPTRRAHLRRRGDSPLPTPPSPPMAHGSRHRPSATARPVPPR